MNGLALAILPVIIFRRSIALNLPTPPAVTSWVAVLAGM